MVEDFSTQFNVLYLHTKAWAGSPGHPVYIYIYINLWHLCIWHLYYPSIFNVYRKLWNANYKIQRIRKYTWNAKCTM